MFRFAVFVVGLASLVARAGEPLPGTVRLEGEVDFAMEMVAGIDRFLLDQTAQSIAARARRWHRETDTPFLEEYQESVLPNRLRLAEIVGAVDERVSPVRMEVAASVGAPPADRSRAHAQRVRWTVFPGVDGEGLLVNPPADVAITKCCVLLPDADRDWQAALFDNQANGSLPRSRDLLAQAARLAREGGQVLIPLLIDRDDTLSVVGGVRKTNQPHREFIYRQAYELGRHIIGYEVQKVLAAVDWFEAESRERGAAAPIEVRGYGEGGLIALYAGALDERIALTEVRGYFDSRQAIWQEPIYRNVWSLLEEFGDAEIASLIFPRRLVVGPADLPEVTGPPAPHDGRSGAAPGRISPPPAERVELELARARQLLSDLRLKEKPDFVSRSPADLADEADSTPRGGLELAAGESYDEVHARQFRQLVDFTQHLLREAEFTRRAYWSDAQPTSIPDWLVANTALREQFYRDVIGRFSAPRSDPRVRTRQVFDEPSYTGYEVQLDVFPEVFASGLLLVPKGIGADERRPCVVCQHGLEGRPRDVADPRVLNKSYNQYGCRLAERGFVVYAPQNPYIGEDRFRALQRKANPLGKSLFSIIVPQHEATVEWLQSLLFVDPRRVGFYGLSYGGKTAMRVPAIVTQYALSICSADFNEWIWKNASTRSPYSYLGTGEYEMFEFNLGNTFNYAEMAALIAPRPFMVERGHDDGVAPDEWVAYEYAKVRRLYAKLKIPERTKIEFFDGPHTIHGVGTFEFLHKHLDWPAPAGGFPPLND